MARTPPIPVLCLPVILAGFAVACERPEGAPRAGPAGVARAAASWLEDATERVGLDFVYDTGARGEFRLPEIMGAGVALLDHDGDSDLDIFLTNGGSAGATNRLYRQESDGRFTDVTAASGLAGAGQGQGMGMAVGDIDNDGDVDVFVTRYGTSGLYRNRGDGSFEDVTVAAGVEVVGWSCSAVFFDYDRDGFLDLYVTRYVKYEPGKSCTDAAGRPDYCAPAAFPPAPDVLLHNEGDGTFLDVSRRAGIQTAIAAGLGVVAADLDADGWPDLYVANDGYANHLWINQRDGTIAERGVVEGVAYDADGRAEASMGVFAADLDEDLELDLFVTNLTGESNTFYRSRGPGRGFEDASAGSGLGPPSLPHTGFGTAAVDLELDGDLDLLVANGRVTRADPRPDAGVGPPWNLFAEPDLALLNSGGGRFAPSGDTAAAFTGAVELSRGLAVGDVDRDGDIDVLVARIHSRARLYLNQAPRRGGWLAVRAVDPRYRRDALGARVTLEVGGARRVCTIGAGSSYLSSSQMRAHFGLGARQGPLELRVDWPDGRVESFRVPRGDREVTVLRGEGRP